MVQNQTSKEPKSMLTLLTNMINAHSVSILISLFTPTMDFKKKTRNLSGSGPSFMQYCLWMQNANLTVG